MRASSMLMTAGLGAWLAACAPVGQRTHYQRWQAETEQRHAEEAQAEAEEKAAETGVKPSTSMPTRTATAAQGTPSIPPPSGRVIRPMEATPPPPPPPPPPDDAVY